MRSESDIKNKVTIYFNGKALRAEKEETVASVLIANDIKDFGRALETQKKSLFCGMGICFECLATIDNKMSIRTCMTQVQEGMKVTYDVFDKDLDKFATQVEDENIDKKGNSKLHRFNYDVLVIGAGPAGENAALEANKKSFKVAIVDERKKLGGQFFKPLLEQHRNKTTLDPQFKKGLELAKKIHDSDIKHHSSSTVIGAWKDGESYKFTLYSSVDKLSFYIYTKSVIIATGSYENVLPIEGWQQSQVMTTGALQTLVRSYKTTPSGDIILCGSGPLLIQVAKELKKNGANVKAIVEAGASPFFKLLNSMMLFICAPLLSFKGLKELFYLKKEKINIFYNTQLTKIAKTDDAFYIHCINTKNKTKKILTADLVSLGYGFSPSAEVAKLLGVQYKWVQKNGVFRQVAEVNKFGQFENENLYVIGEAKSFGGAFIAAILGQIAGQNILSKSKNTALKDIYQKLNLYRHNIFQKNLWRVFNFEPLELSNPETILCRCENVSFKTIQNEIDKGICNIGTLKKKTRCGMGLCQGKYCMDLLANYLHKKSDITLNEKTIQIQQIPIRPFPIASFMKEQEEWRGHKRVAPINKDENLDSPSDIIDTKDIAIIGGGIAGISTAYFLNQKTNDFCLIEQAAINGEASGGNAGSLHAQLLSFDFDITELDSPALKTLELQKESIKIWRSFDKKFSHKLDFSQKGGLMVAETKDEIARLKAKIQIEKKFGIDSEFLDKTDLKKLAPYLSDGIMGAAFCKEEGKINPLTATFAIKESMDKKNFHEYTKVLNIKKDKNSAYYHIYTNRGIIKAKNIVNNAGSWARNISQMLGYDIPVYGTPLMLAITEKVKNITPYLLAHVSRHLTLKQTNSGQFIIGGGWPACESDKRRAIANDKSLKGNFWVARKIFPDLDKLNIIRTWGAMNIDIDGAPILGNLGGDKNVWVGVTSNGYTLGPIVGKITSDLILEGKSDYSIDSFTDLRFKT